MTFAAPRRPGRHRRSRLPEVVRRGAVAAGVSLLIAAGLWAVSPPSAQAAIVPVAYDDAYAGDRDTPFSVGAPGVLGNDFGVGPGYRARLVNDNNLWQTATLDFHADGSFDYDPHSPDLAGENSFVYCISTTESSTCVSNEATVYLFIDEPFVIPHSYGMAAGDVLTVAAPGLLIGSRNPKPDDVLYQLTGPQHGTVDLQPNGAFSYTPDAGFTGTDGFGYCLSNDTDWPACSGNAAGATISVYPTAQDQTVDALQDTPYTGRLYPPTGGAVTFGGLVTDPPDHGAVSVANDGSFTYTPAAGYVGGDAFQFCLTSDNSNCLTVDRATVTITVAPLVVTTTTTLTGPGTVFYGQAATLHAAVQPAVDGGTITVSSGGSPVPGCNSVPVAGSAADCTVPAASLGIGAHAFVASYSGAGNFTASTSPAATVTVTPAPTAVSYRGDTTGTIGAPIQVSARLASTAAGASGAVSGRTLIFSMADSLTCTGVTDGAGNASCTLTPNQAGPLTITATFGGDAEYQRSQIDGTVTVGKKSSTTSLQAVPNPVPWSDDVTLTASVTAGATGTVAFESAGSAIAGCAAVPVTAGKAECVTDSLEVGGQSVTAGYSGDETYADSSDSATVEVQQRAIDLSYVGPGTGTVGGALALSGKAVDHLSGDPIAGLHLDLTFQGTSCGGTTGQDGTAACTVALTEAGTSDVAIDFAGTAHYSAATGSGQATIAKAVTGTTVTVEETPTAFSLPVTVTATVTPTDGGTVAFTTADGDPLTGCEAVALVPAGTGPNWTASCSTATLPVGANEITATFSGTDNYLGSAGTATATVDPAPTGLTYTGATEGTVVAPLAVSALLTNTAGTDPVPLTGQTIVFTLADGVSCTAVTDDSATAACSLTPTAVAQAGPIEVTFAGTTEYLQSSTTADISVALAPTTTVLSAPTTAAFGTSVTLAATVDPSDGTGTVAFTLAGTAIAGCEAATLTERDGHRVAECVTSGLPVGDDEITATYSGTADYVGSADTATVVESAAPTGLAYTGATTGVVGAPLTMSAVLTNTPADAVIAGQQLTFTRGGLTCTATTGDDGVASCRLMPTAIAQAGPLTVTFAGTTEYLESVATTDISLDPAATTLDYLGPTSATVGSPLAVSAGLRIVSTAAAPAVLAVATDGHPLRRPAASAAPAPAVPVVAIGGLRLRFALGPAHCEAVTSDDGEAGCSLTPTTADPAATLVVTFAGTADLSAAGSRTDILVAAAPAPPSTAPGTDGTTPPANSSDPTSSAAPTSSTKRWIPSTGHPPAAHDGLAATGYDTGRWLTIALLLFGAGSLLIFLGRRRGTSRRHHRVV